MPARAMRFLHVVVDVLDWHPRSLAVLALLLARTSPASPVVRGIDASVLGGELMTVLAMCLLGAPVDELWNRPRTPSVFGVGDNLEMIGPDAVLHPAQMVDL